MGLLRDAPALARRRPRRRITAVVATAAVALWALVVVAPARSAPSTALPKPPLARPSGCDDRGWVGGTTEWCHGVLVHRDYVYDDNGADSRQGSIHGTSLTRAVGDVDHREHGQSLNSADLLVLRVAPAGNRLRVRAELNTLFPDDRTVVAVALDLDDDRTTGGGQWRSGTESIAVSSDGWDVVHILDRRDADANTITGEIDRPRSPRFRLQAVVALGDGTPMNVAFRPDETGNWWEAEQAAALAAGDVSAFGHTVDAADLDGRTHRPAPLPGPGVYERILRHDHAPGEGVDYDGTVGRGGDATAFGQAYHYLGNHQPYGLYVPEPDATGTYGLQLMLHGRSAAHASLLRGPGLHRAFGSQLVELGDRPRLVLIPLGRGPESYYIDWAERDVLDTLDDVQARYPVDPDRVFVGGYSMGGYGAYRFAAFHPDRFAGGAVWVGYTGDCLNGTPAAQGRQRSDDSAALFSNELGAGCPAGSWGNMLDHLEGARHVPLAMSYAGEDELVFVNHAVGLARRYDELGYEHVLYLHPVAEHLTFALLDRWDKEAAWTAGRLRVRRPARVSYRMNPLLWFPDAGVRHDRAYWVQGLTARTEAPDPSGDVAVELTSHACPDAGPGDHGRATLANGAGVEPLPWVSQEGVPAEVAVAGRTLQRLVTGSLTNVGSLTIDTAAACLGDSRSGPITFAVEVDGPTTVRFTDGRPPVVLTPRAS